MKPAATSYSSRSAGMQGIWRHTDNTPPFGFDRKTKVANAPHDRPRVIRSRLPDGPAAAGPVPGAMLAGHYRSPPNT
jgi:hypothetical protein